MASCKNTIKILIVLVHSTQNMGDLALLNTSIQLLKRYFPNADFLISANYPDEIWYAEKGLQVIPSPTALVGKSYGWTLLAQVIQFILGCLYSIIYKTILKSLVPEKWVILLNAYTTSNIVVAVPGNQFFSTGRLGWPFPVSLMSLSLAHLFKKPLYILPQSLGPFRRWWEKKLIRWVYSKAHLIFLRDQISIELARSIGLPENKVSYAPDPAFALGPDPREYAQHLLKSYGWRPDRPSLGVTIIAPMGRSLDRGLVGNYHAILTEALINFALLHDIQIVFFSQVIGPTILEDDRIPTWNIFQLVRSRIRNTILIDTISSPSLLKACYGEMSLFLASRLHSGIFAIGMGVPTIFIGYLSKTQGVLRSLGLEEFGIELKSLDQHKLLSLLNKAWTSRIEISLRLTEMMKTISSEVQLPFQRIALEHL